MQNSLPSVEYNNSNQQLTLQKQMLKVILDSLKH